MIKEPLIQSENYNINFEKNFNVNLKNNPKQTLFFEYPVVYIVIEDKTNFYKIYVGETSNIISRTKQHLAESEYDWLQFNNSKNVKIFVIAHEMFNKSLTLDIENKLMQYMSSVECIDTISNKRLNPQNKYYTYEHLDKIFSKIWKKLNRINKRLFPVESIVRDSAIFKASPFNKLTSEQIIAKNKIISKIDKSLNFYDETNLIIVSGNAGSGKTVLMSNLFFELIFNNRDSGLDIKLLVNHNEQLKVYKQIASRLGIENDKKDKLIMKPTSLINNYLPDKKIDVIIVDEAHLLLTQGKQSYRGNNHLEDLLKIAKVVVAVFDRKQILQTNQYLNDSQINSIFSKAKKKDNYIFLENQMRIVADKKTINWVRKIVDEGVVGNIPQDDSKGYDIKIFESASELYEKIKLKNKELGGLSRVVATYDWQYKSNDKENIWYVNDGDFKLPWNLQLKDTNKNINYKNLSWAEQAHTINEVGSTFTVQGFDLNYIGVIIGESVKYRNGKIVYDKTKSYNKNSINKRTSDNGNKIDVSNELLRNELNVLITRGIKGLFIYAVDKELQKVLLKAQKGDL